MSPSKGARASGAQGRQGGKLVRVEAMYPFDWPLVLRGRPSDIDSALGEVLVGLPGDLGRGRWEWFGEEKDGGPYLWGSVEPSGFQVGGMLTNRQWDEWRAAFKRCTAALPRRRAGW